MSVKSNVAWFQLGKQSGLDVLASTFDFRSRLASDDRLAPRAEMATFAETDGSRDQPNEEKMQGGVEGSVQFGVRDAFFHKVAEAALGNKVTTGTTNYTHTVSTLNGGADATLSPYSLQQNLGDVLFEEAKDLFVNEWSVTAEAGGFLTSTLAFLGRSVARSDVTYTGPSIASGALYTFNDVTVSIGGAATAKVRSFNFTLGNNIVLQQTDDFKPEEVHVGQRELTVGFDIIFTDLAHYNAFHYGSPTGTVQSGSTYTTDLNFNFAKGVNNGIEFDFDAVNVSEFPVGADTGGEPIVVPARARARRNAAGLMKTIVKNQTAL